MPEAIRYCDSSRAHREIPFRMGAGSYVNTACWKYIWPSAAKTVPLDQVPPADRCRRCWPEYEGETE